jgi:multidrug efflux system membrane fusion protein
MSRYAVALLAVMLGVMGCSRSAPVAPQQPPPEVPVAYPIQHEITDYAEYTGRTAAIHTVTVIPRATGYIIKIPFKEGSDVKKGDLLFKIDPRSYQALIDQAQGQINLYKAQLKLARTTLVRYQASGPTAVSKEEMAQVQAQVEQAEAQLKAAQASMEVNKLNLEYTDVTSPIDGRVSNYYLTIGNLAVQDRTALTTVVSQDPMYAYFDVDEPTVLRVREEIRKGKLKSLREEGTQIPVYLGLTNETGFPHEGYLDFANNQFNPSTGTLRVRGVFANPKPKKNGVALLSPGMFVRIRVPISPSHQAILISQDAVGTDQNLNFVYVVDQDNKVVRRDVTLGTIHDNLQVIDKGLQPDERLVITGVQHVRPGMTVNPSLVPMPGLNEE